MYNEYGPILSAEQETILRNVRCYYKDLWVINKVLLLLNEHGDHSFKFQNLSSYNTNKQMAKLDKNLSAGSISLE